ncbi:MAG: bacteriophage holin [Thermoanaerobaculales bacterium]
MRLNGKAFALACGVFWGLTILVMTVWLVVLGSEGQLMQQLNHFYFGYSVSWLGALVGAVWGFVDGCICGWIFAWLYNKIAGE